MKKIIRIITCLAVLLSLTIGTQSFVNPAPAPSPAPSYTMVEISGAGGYYAVRVDLAGPWFEDNTYTVFSTNNIEYNTSDPAVITSTLKYYYSAASEHTTCQVYTKATSSSSWENNGSINTDDNRVTKTTGGYFLQKMSFDMSDLPNP
ncbi:MAG: hypothetical protein KAH17_08880 [Bacteroidales bacterium]|nr:hypothetical protein [Bacteroidales bacterium]